METKSRKYIIGLGILLLVLVLLVLFIIFRSVGDNGTLGGNGGFFSGILPDTSGDGNTNGADGESSGNLLPPPPTGINITGISEEEKALLVQLSKEPVVGATTKYGEDKVLYFKRGVGNIFEIPFDGSAPEERIFHFTIPNIIGASWSPKRTYAIVSAQAEDSLKHIWINVTSTSTLETGFLKSDVGGDINGVAFSPTEDKLAIVSSDKAGSTVLISDPRGKSQRRVTSLAVFDAQPSWIAKNMLSLQTKPSALSTSLLATVDMQSGASEILLSDVQGLDTKWSGDGARFLALETYNGGKGFTLSLRNKKNPESKQNLQYVTLPEKCIFSSIATTSAYCAFPKDWGRGILPDSWWQGKVSFSDELWLVDFVNGTNQQILSGGGFDMTNLFMSKDERYIFFTNKKDSTLWSLRLGE